MSLDSFEFSKKNSRFFCKDARKIEGILKNILRKAWRFAKHRLILLLKVKLISVWIFLMCSMVLEILAFLGFLTADIYFSISIVVKNMKFRPFTTYILSRFVRIRFVRPFHGTVDSNKSRDCCTVLKEAKTTVVDICGQEIT